MYRVVPSGCGFELGAISLSSGPMMRLPPPQRWSSRVSIADALTVSLLSAAVRWARRENGDGEGSKEEQPPG